MSVFESLFFDRNIDGHQSILKPKINYYYEYFSHNNKFRKKEIDYTLEFNCLQSPNTNKYIICNSQFLNECKKITNNSKNTTIIEYNQRCTFQYIFDLSNIITTHLDINITSNNDILLDKTFFENMSINYNDFYWLSRYEKKTNRHPIRTGKSADTWVWRGKNKIKKANFYYGLLGCDNQIGFLARSAGYTVKNTSYTYKTYHNHGSQYRTDSKNWNLAVSDGSNFNLKPHR